MTIRFGVIGTGAIGREHMRRITQKLLGGEIAAVTDIDLSAARKAVEELGIEARIYPEEELLADRSIDAVIITSWGPAHEASVLAAIAAGKYVFVEKPLATTIEGCERIVQAEEKIGRRMVQVGYMRRYDRGYQALKSVVACGELGSPLMVRCTHRNAAVDERYTTEMAVLDTLVHELDVTRWLVGDDYAEVQAVFPRRTKYAHEALQDPQIFLLRTQTGIVITAEVFVNCRYGYDIQCEIVCEEGTVSLPAEASVEFKHDALHKRAVPQDWKLRFADAYDAELQDFINQVERCNEPQGPSAWDGYLATLAAEACVRAQKSQGWESVTPGISQPKFIAGRV
ncbi:Gfo/Idh/MocA family protein [Alicyclobacillus vulcanalis]|uniref:Inositol 2-dehydrogenase/D-chiro-inositol 3-dehydrogenase n=1 Tax=Alicyclobacillus vulcanalis TaxID=252246 RepID=A0A1N7NLX1_9BACL|nr:Gfo/Idh/MocA family oxidoreductase [Alicyclobacillus vulcanalis]SIS99281.1 myo-inositol 2-dehydrogenase [Alicyclobacillus vulcanalis]